MVHTLVIMSDGWCEWEPVAWMCITNPTRFPVHHHEHRRHIFITIPDLLSVWYCHGAELNQGACKFETFYTKQGKKIHCALSYEQAYSVNIFSQLSFISY